MMTTARPQISNRSARALFLERHGLSGKHDWMAPGGDLMGLVEHLGFVQVDSINTVERAHHMILSARSKPYRPKQLRRLLERDRAVFEHWTHDAALIPMQFYPYWQLRFARDTERLGERWKKWRGDGFRERFDEVLRHIEESGPVTARTVGDGEVRGPSGGWWDWHPSKTALEFLWRTGRLAVARRDGFVKVFDLAERVIPADVLAARPTEEETVDWACRSALERLGFATSGELAAFWGAVTPQEAKDWCNERLGGALIKVDVDSVREGERRTMFAAPSIEADIAAVAEPPDRLRILSPFDPLLRDRNRAERLFGFFYRIEVFVPAERRQYGYYVFPVLEKDRLIGRIDMKRRPTGDCLEVAAFWPEPGTGMGKRRADRLDAELHRIARFAGCDAVHYRDGWLREPA